MEKYTNMDFQTPDHVAQYMCGLIPPGTKTILEPTPGEGNILKHLSGYDVTAPSNFFMLQQSKYDCIVMNPPFSDKTAFGYPESPSLKGMRLGYYIFEECMKMSDHVIALMTWFTLTDSDVRMKKIKDFGLKSITTLPRKTFQYSRIQTCILELQKGFSGETVFKIISHK